MNSTKVKPAAPVVNLSLIFRLASLLVVLVFPTPAPAGTWTTNLAPLPTTRSSFAAAALNDLIYTVGGQAPTDPVRVVEVYDPSTDTWSTVAPFPFPIHRAGAAALNGLLYVAGGCSDAGCGSFLNTFYAYDPSTDTWTTRAPMLTARRDPNFLAVVNGIIYAAGGGQGPGCSSISAVEAYDPLTNTWTARAPMQMEHWGAAVTSLNGKVYVAGGVRCIGGTFTFPPNVEAYNPLTNTWAQVAPLPFGLNAPEGGVLNGKMYVADANANGACVACTLAYDPAANTWSTEAGDPTARFGPQGDIVDDILYAIGGIGNTILNTNSAFSPVCPGRQRPKASKQCSR